MATATITLVDKDGSVDIKVDFGEQGVQDASEAHVMALVMVKLAQRAYEDGADDV